MFFNIIPCLALNGKKIRQYYVEGTFHDNRHLYQDLKDTRYLEAHLKVHLGKEIYHLNFYLDDLGAHGIKMSKSSQTDYARFIKDFPYSYSSSTTQWLPIGYATEVAQEIIGQLTGKELKEHNAKTHLLHTLHEYAKVVLWVAYTDFNKSIFILNKNEELKGWDVYYHGVYKAKDLPNIPYTRILVNRYIMTSENCTQEQAIQTVIKKLSEHERPIFVPDLHEIQVYSSTERKLKFVN